jgi:hypothetical protein
MFQNATRRHIQAQGATRGDTMASAAQPSTRATAVILAACAVLMLVAMLHHPVARHGADPAAAIVAVGPLNAIVHGTLIVLILVVRLAMQRVADRLRGLGIDPRAGLLALTVSVSGYVIAASFNGFITPQVAAEAHAMGEPQRAAFPLVLEALASTSQYCAVLASIAMGVGLIAWAAPMLTRRDSRWPGVVGALAGAAMLVATFAGQGHVNVTLMTALTAALGVWLVCLAIWLWRQPQRSAAT